MKSNVVIITYSSIQYPVHCTVVNNITANIKNEIKGLSLRCELQQRHQAN